jgi:enoyl-[acyl-carrier protein] reductase / trans-2-enoyl-CoA reductase (NAD+)
MIIEPKIRGFICTTAHPKGCAENVRQQIDYVEEQGALTDIKNVLIIGCSTGYGLASRVVASYACNASTLGIMFEKAASGKRTASPGWYNTAAYEEFASDTSTKNITINGDAFSTDIKEQTIETIKKDFQGKIDLVIYSLASPRRTDPTDGKTYHSTLKPIGKSFTEKTVDANTGQVTDITIEPASNQEIGDTIKVMGGEDWALWIDALLAEDLLSDNAKTIAYSYIGPDITHSIYRNGTIGKAKEHLEKTATQLQEKMSAINGNALISVNKAVVTQASSAIPVVPLYNSILYKVMKNKGVHEDCIQQIYRLFKDNVCKLQRDNPNSNFIRLDNLEMASDIQDAVKTLWQQVTTENLEANSDIAGYRSDFHRLFGFASENVDYSEDIDPGYAIKSLL